MVLIKSQFKLVSVFMWFSLLVVSTTGCASNPSQNQASVNQASAESSQLGPYEKTNDEPTVVAYENYSDPLRVINRPIFAFNNYSYRYVLSPISQGYLKITPKPVDKSIRNFFLNLREPLYFLNNLLQLNVKDSGKSLLRLGINSTVGLLGLFDPAASWGIDRAKTTFGDTLAYYGAGYGAYLVLPLLGPSDLRDATSITFEYFAHPLNYINDEKAATALLVTDGYIKRTGDLARYPDVVREADDAYTFVRNLYLQGVQRDATELTDEDHPTSNNKLPDQQTGHSVNLKDSTKNNNKDQ